MKNIVLLFSAIITGCIITACNDTDPQKGEILTRRIQYDVAIKSPDPSFDWWIQNIDGETRESFVRRLLESSYSGKLRTYDIFHKELSPEQVKAVGKRTDTLTFQRAVPPYELFDTVVHETFSIKDISKIRFLEEWTTDPGTMQISKRVIGISPLLERYGQDGELRGYMPMFWIYFDADYPAAFSTSLP